MCLSAATNEVGIDTAYKNTKKQPQIYQSFDIFDETFMSDTETLPLLFSLSCCVHISMGDDKSQFIIDAWFIWSKQYPPFAIGFVAKILETERQSFATQCMMLSTAVAPTNTTTNNIPTNTTQPQSEQSGFASLSRSF